MVDHHCKTCSKLFSCKPSKKQKYCCKKCFYNNLEYRLNQSKNMNRIMQGNKRRLNKKLTEIQIKELSNSLLGRKTWNKGLKGKEYLAHYKNGMKYPDNRLEKHPNWQGGKSFEPYPITFNNEFKRYIKERDNFCCTKCNKTQAEENIHALLLYGLHKKSLVVHHINYDKSLTIPENCCLLCIRCNTEVNHNRKHWTKFFQSLMSEKYGYKYQGEIPILNFGRN